jgi:hypothetical protein
VSGHVYGYQDRTVSGHVYGYQDRTVSGHVYGYQDRTVSGHIYGYQGVSILSLSELFHQCGIFCFSFIILTNDILAFIFFVVSVLLFYHFVTS